MKSKTDPKTDKAENKEDLVPETSKTDTNKIKQEAERSNFLAKKLQKDSFHKIWEFYKAKENTEKLSKGNIAAHFFYLGAKKAFEEKTKDYTAIKKENENRKIDSIKTQKILKEIKRNIFKIKKDRGLDIKNTIKLFRTALKENKDNKFIKEHLKKEIDFLEDYRKKKNTKTIHPDKVRGSQKL